MVCVFNNITAYCQVCNSLGKIWECSVIVKYCGCVWVFSLLPPPLPPPPIGISRSSESYYFPRLGHSGQRANWGSHCFPYQLLHSGPRCCGWHQCTFAGHLPTALQHRWCCLFKGMWSEKEQGGWIPKNPCASKKHFHSCTQEGSFVDSPFPPAVFPQGILTPVDFSDCGKRKEVGK